MRIQTLGAITGGSESQWIYGNDRSYWSLKISEKLKMKLWERMSEDSEMEKVRILRLGCLAGYLHGHVVTIKMEKF